jgi:4-amino-4-deoxychorismate lyase
MLRNGALFTPDLSNCGVAGMQRDRVMEWAQRNDMPCNISSLSLADLLTADEVFLVNSIIGLWPVREMPGFRREQFPISLRIQHWLNHENS